MDPTTARALPYIVPMVVLALVLRRALRSRTLKMERLWIYPAILVFVAGSVILRSALPGPLALAGLAAALAIGGLIGWYRGRLTDISIDPVTHVLSSKASVAGTVLIAVVFALRYGLELTVQGGGAAPIPMHLDVALITDGLMLFLVGMMSVQRIEMFIRCRKLLEDARGSGIIA